MSIQATEEPAWDGERLALEFLRRVWSPPHELSAIDELMTEDYVITSAGTRMEGRRAFTEWIRDFHRLLPDARTESVEILSDPARGRVVSRWMCTGRSNGVFGLPADGRPVAFTGITIWAVRDGRLAECWVERSGPASNPLPPMA